MTTKHKVGDVVYNPIWKTLGIVTKKFKSNHPMDDKRTFYYRIQWNDDECYADNDGVYDKDDISSFKVSLREHLKNVSP